MLANVQPDDSSNPPAEEAESATKIVWKPISSAPRDGQRVIVSSICSSGDSFIAIGSMVGGGWKLEIDSIRYRGTVVTPNLWTEIPEFVPPVAQRSVIGSK